MLTDAALEGKRDRLVGLKENVIIGKLIPAATGLRHYRTLAIEPAEPVEPPSEEGLLDEEELAAELGLEAATAPSRELRPLLRGGAGGARAGDRADLGRAGGNSAVAGPGAGHFRPPAGSLTSSRPNCRRDPGRQTRLRLSGGRSRRLGVRLAETGAGRLAGLASGEGLRDRRRILGDRRLSGAAGARDPLRLLREGLGGRRQLALRERQRDVLGLPLAPHQHLARADVLRDLPDAGRLPRLPEPLPDRPLLRRLRRPFRLPRRISFNTEVVERRAGRRASGR